MFVFFFKQKTAYEMRISDWSSDVCSSDLGGQRRGVRGLEHPVPLAVDHRALLLRVAAPEQEHQALALAVEGPDDMVGEAFPARSEERRVGKECVSTV